MFTSARSAQVAVNGDKINYLVFGKGPKTLVILPGLGDGLTPVHGQSGTRFCVQLPADCPAFQSLFVQPPQYAAPNLFHAADGCRSGACHESFRH